MQSLQGVLLVLLGDPAQDGCVRAANADDPISVHEDAESMFGVPSARKLVPHVSTAVRLDVVQMDLAENDPLLQGYDACIM